MSSGAWNMSVDEALLEHVREHGPALRFYGWERPTATLGYRQKAPDWLERARALGVDVVRRATGGGTVLHAADLTYSVVAPRAWPGLPRDPHGSFAWIRDVLLHGLAELGLAARPSAGSAQASRSALCFAAATGTEIDLLGVKLVGSAQRRTSYGFLQHGSIRLRPDDGLYERLFGAPLEALPEPVEALAAGQVAGALRDAFATALHGALQSATLSPGEDASARRRLAERRQDPLVAPGLSLTRAPASADRFP